MLAETMTERLRGGRPLAWWGLILAGVVVHALFWTISQPEQIFGDIAAQYGHRTHAVDPRRSVGVQPSCISSLRTSVVVEVS